MKKQHTLYELTAMRRLDTNSFEFTADDGSKFVLTLTPQPQTGEIVGSLATDSLHMSIPLTAKEWYERYMNGEPVQMFRLANDPMLNERLRDYVVSVLGWLINNSISPHECKYQRPFLKRELFAYYNYTDQTLPQAQWAVVRSVAYSMYVRGPAKTFLQRLQKHQGYVLEVLNAM